MDWSSCTTGPDGTVASIKCIDIVIFNLVKYAFVFAGSVAVIIIILAGIKFILSHGDPKNLQSARQTMTWGIIGLVIILLAFMIVTFIGFVTGTMNTCIFDSIINAKSQGFGSCG